MTHYLDLSDGRRLAYEVTGDPDGFPVFLLHGTPGSRRGPQPRGVTLYRRGIRLISYDRPGYGESTRMEGRTVVDAAADVLAVARELRLPRFAVVGRSGGAPHALACAAQLPGIVTSVAAMVSLTPRNAPGIDWEAGMMRANQVEFGLAGTDPGELVARLADRMVQVRRDPSAMLPVIDEGLDPADRRVIGDGGIRGQLFDSYRMAFKTDLWGHFDDVMALADRRGWGFEPKDVHLPVLLWHGSQDTFSPKSHTEWLGQRISDPPAHVVVEPQASHFTAIERLPDVLAWVVENSGADRSSEPVGRIAG